MYDVIVRGGWDFSFLSNIFVYLICYAVVVARVGRVLAGWQNGKVTVYPPDFRVVLDSEDENTQKKIKSLRIDLFEKVIDKLDSKIIDVLFSTLLKNYNDCVQKYPNNI